MAQIQVLQMMAHQIFYYSPICLGCMPPYQLASGQPPPCLPSVIRMPEDSGGVGIKLFQSLARHLSSRPYALLLKEWNRNYNIKEFKLNLLSIDMTVEMYEAVYINKLKLIFPHLSFRILKSLAQSELNWWENQLRLFVWTLLAYIDLKEKSILDLGPNDWEFFSELFPHKMLILFEYQGITLLKEQGPTRKWVHSEDETFVRLIKEKGLKSKWSQLAKCLYIETDRKYFRTPKQCRERWLNHLDPSKSKEDWTLEEDFILVAYVKDKGKRWAEIVKVLYNRRNEHSIKNRFKSLATKEEKAYRGKSRTEEQVVEAIYRYLISLFKETPNIGSPSFPLPARPQEQWVQVSPEKIQSRESLSSNKDPRPRQPLNYCDVKVLSSESAFNDRFSPVSVIAAQPLQYCREQFEANRLDLEDPVLEEALRSDLYASILSDDSNLFGHLSPSQHQLDTERRLRNQIKESQNPFAILHRFFRCKDQQSTEESQSMI